MFIKWQTTKRNANKSAAQLKSLEKVRLSTAELPPIADDKTKQ